MIIEIKEVYAKSDISLTKIKCAVRSYGIVENTYILVVKNREMPTEKEMKNGIIIDPGTNDEEIYEYIEKENINIKKIILTHNHGDHIAGLDKAVKNTGAKVCISKQDGETLGKDMDNHYKMFRIEKIETKPDILLNHLDEIKFEGKKIIFHLTPGHTKGSMCIEIEGTNILLTGDTLFKGTYGRCDLYGGDVNQMVKSLEYIYERFDAQTIIFPGHGSSIKLGENIIEI